MFEQIYKMLKLQAWYNSGPEIEILKGGYSKIENWNDLKNRTIRWYKYQNQE